MDAALEKLLAPVLNAPEEWERKAAERRELSPVDPVADMLVVLARDLRTRLAQVDAVTALLTPEQYAALPSVRVTPQAVRRWCRRGQLAGARLTPHGWEIPIGAVRQVPERPRVTEPEARSA